MNDRTDEELDASEPEEHLLRLRHLRVEDIDDVRAIQEAVYARMKGPLAVLSRDKLAAQIGRFPEGQICIEDNGRVVAVALSLVVDYERFGDQHTYAEITGDGWFTTHDPDGDVLYGTDVFVHPDCQEMRLGRRLYDARKQLCRRLNLKAIIAGGRIPGYEQYAGEMEPHEYIDRVDRQELHDPVLSFQLSNDFHVRRIMRGYMPGDVESQGYATLIQWENIYFQRRKRPLVGERKHVARLGTVQWQMRRTESVEDMLNQVEFFVDAVADYKADFVLFPEFFNVPLMSLVDQQNAAEAMRQMSSFTTEIVAAMEKMAIRYNINIVGGSMPVVEDGELFNVAYLFRRDGTFDTQYKLHITPTEKRYWALSGGRKLKVLETDAGRIGIQICYDVEFPELSRLLASRGMEILFVPFWTETKNGYLRVRRCAQARAIENECYVALSGSVGNLPRVDNVNVHYAQTAVFSPSDFAFPHDGVVSESTPNTETMLIVDLELDKLKRLRDEGSVRNSRDRRLDLYRLDWIGGED